MYRSNTLSENSSLHSDGKNCH